MKYIIDTDPGIDDAIGLMLGVKNNLDIIGFTLANGNIPAEKAEKNLKVIQDFLDSDIKMYKGKFIHECDMERAEYAHGKDGLGYAVFPDNNKRKFEKMPAEDFIIKAAKKYKDNLTVICFGPLTNLANAIKKDKNLTKNLKNVLIMGVTYNPDSKKTYMEFNVNIDPDAAKLVFKTPFENIKVVTHEIGVQSFIEKEYIENLRNSNELLSRFVSLIAQKYMEFSYDHYGTVGLGTPDPTTIASIIEPSIVKFEPCNIDFITVEDKGTKCNVTLTNDSNIKISTEFDLEKFRRLFKNTFK
ncbi:MAG: nucleoside hydrolase [Firmicutes bacterium]|nr:nucleoside hydrolase [Bacillota bacterium]